MFNNFQRYVCDKKPTKSILRNLTSYKFRQEIAAAVFAATPPSLIKTISTSKGVYLIWVEETIQPILDQHLLDQIQQ
ncbi:MAG: hypothetical protein KME46_08410 [Brasilonema angustatum HA4187-MV1]|nr:hypothetical protein [Brasilonema angustatum HA4187-MV1]